VRSIQNQSFKNIEIILVDDYSSDSINDIYNKLLLEDPRIRIFIHTKNMGIFRSRLDGFLYSRGKYILNFNSGDLFYDNLVLEDLYNTIVKYNLDSLRFSFKTYRHIIDNIYSISNHKYPSKKMIIKYGKIRENVRFFSYDSICNRLIRSNVILKGLNNVDSYVFNAYNNLLEDTMWNSLVNEVTFGHTTINRLGYIYCSSTKIENNLTIDTQEQRDYLIIGFLIMKYHKKMIKRKEL
jgi:glycosyltransferase involved in cell wall biosynthesis